MKKTLVFIPLAIALLVFPGLPIPAHAALSWETTVQGPFTWEQALSHCETLETGGHTDWRLPDINELQSIVRYDFYDPAAGVSGVQSAFYWSSTTHHSSNTSAWGVNFTNGDITTKTKTESFYVLAVRGGSYSPKCTPDPGNGDGTVTDPESGLTWEQATSGPMTWEEALAHAEDLNVGGHSDWRLPDINELQSLVRYDEYNPAIEGSDCFKYGPFPDMIAGFFWSSSTHHSSNGSAWGVDFNDGDVTTKTKTEKFYVRAIRGGSHEPRCTPDPGNGNGTVTDAESGLMWGQDTIGPMTWQAALEHCETLTLGNHSDWRLPDVNELQSLVRYDSYNPAIRGSDCYKYGPFPDMVSGFFWSSTTHHSSNTSAWGVNFTNGDITTKTKTDLFYVRPVRSETPAHIEVQAWPGSTGGVPFSVDLFATPFGPLMDRYEWYLTGGDEPDAVTFDGAFSTTIINQGDYSIDVTGYDAQGRAYASNIYLKALSPTTIGQACRFAAHYPKSDAISSVVMQGGKAVRYYRVYDANNQPITEKILYYKYQDGSRLESPIDDQGFVEITSPPTDADVTYRLTVTDQNGNPLNLDMAGVPEFSVAVEDREFSEKYKLLIGMGGSVGFTGPKFSLGPVKFKTAELGLRGEKNISTTITLKNAGSTTDMEMDNALGVELGGDAWAGVSASIFKEHSTTRGRPELGAGAGLDVSVNTAMTTRHRFEDFFNDNRPDHNDQLFVAAVLFFENLLKLDPMYVNNILTRAVLDHAVARIVDSDRYYKHIGLSAGAAAKLNVGTKLSLQNPLGFAPGSKPKFNLDAFELGAALEIFGESDVSGANKLGLTLSSNLDLGSFGFGFSQKFGGDRRRKDTPKFSMGLLDLALKRMESEMTIGADFDPHGDWSLFFSMMTNRAGGNKYIVYSWITETFLDFVVKDQTVLNVLEGQSDFIAQVREGEEFDISETAFLGVTRAIQDLSDGTVEWAQTQKESQLISIPLAFGLGLGVGAEISFQVDVKSVIDYATTQGLLGPELGMIRTAVYEKDAYIENNIRGVEAVVEPYVDAIDGVLDDALETVEKIAEAGVELAVETGEAIVDGGAKIIAGTGKLAKGAALKISRLFSWRRSYRIAARGPRTNGEAATVGDVFIVTVQAEDGTLVADLSEPLELTIGYTDADLLAAGFASTDAAKLAIYHFNADTGYYEHVGGQVDAANHALTAMIDQTGQYVLAIDAAPPAVSDFIVMEGGTTPLIRLTIMDGLSGLDLDALVVKLDGETVMNKANLPDTFHVRNGVLEWRPTSPLAEGEHELEVTAADTAGNIDATRFAFRVDVTPPVMTHSPVATAAAGTDLTIEANVSEDQALAGVFLHYRPQTDERPFSVAPMTAIEGTTTYAGAIPKADITSKGVRYYVRAVDAAGNESFSDQVDIVVQDDVGPEAADAIMVAPDPDGVKVYWLTPEDADIAGYRVYVGASPDALSLHEDVGLVNWTILDAAFIDQYVAISAYDATGNEGARTQTLDMKSCDAGDVDCNGEIDLADAITALKILTGVALINPPAQIADVNGDGVIGLAEAVHVLQRVAGW